MISSDLSQWKKSRYLHSMTTLQSPEISLSLGEEIRHSDYNQEEADEEKDEAGNLTATFHPPPPLINQH